MRDNIEYLVLMPSIQWQSTYVYAPSSDQHALSELNVTGFSDGSVTIDASFPAGDIYEAFVDLQAAYDWLFDWPYFWSIECETEFDCRELLP